MRIYSNPAEAIREVERDLWEMGIIVHPQTMQDKEVADDPQYNTKEVQGYGFKIVGWKWNEETVLKALSLLYDEERGEVKQLCAYIKTEFTERISNTPSNPGISYHYREDIWKEFLHNGKFAYTYSERISPQLPVILRELRTNPETRQAVITIHSNICPNDYKNSTNPTKFPNYVVLPSNDLKNIGGGARVPCSIYYQFMIRGGKLDMVYTMRSCDFLTHFVIDLLLALRFQNAMAEELNLKVGTFTYFTGSLHAYNKDMIKRGIF